MTEDLGTARPLTPFFLYREEERRKGNDIDAKKVGAKWKKLKAGDKEKYIKKYKEAKDRYDEHIHDLYGVDIKTYQPPTTKEPGYPTTRVRAVIGQDPEIRPMKRGTYPALKKVLVQIQCAERGRNCSCKTLVRP